MNVLVTGGAGYIGSHTCKQLKQEGFTPVVYDNLSTGHKEAVKWGSLIHADVLDTPKLTHVLDVYDIDAVIHFAASAYVGESVADPAKYWTNNVGGMISLLNACQSAKFPHVVFSSSCAVYGLVENPPISEKHPFQPISPYGRTKMVGELMLQDLAAASALRYVALRYFNAAGTDPSGELNEDHRPETHLIPRALMAAAGQIDHLEIFGTDYPTPDGTCVRDYIHVTDLARAHVMALQHLLAGKDSLAVNLGAGRGVSIWEVLKSIKYVTGVDVPCITRPRREGDPPEIFAQTRLAKEVLGFEPELSDLDRIVETAAPHFGLDCWRKIPRWRASERQNVR